jgi:hypothetical protein
MDYPRPLAILKTSAAAITALNKLAKSTNYSVMRRPNDNTQPRLRQRKPKQRQKKTRRRYIGTLSYRLEELR